MCEASSVLLCRVGVCRVRAEPLLHQSHRVRGQRLVVSLAGRSVPREPALSTWSNGLLLLPLRLALHSLLTLRLLSLMFTTRFKFLICKFQPKELLELKYRQLNNNLILNLEIVFMLKVLSGKAQGRLMEGK